MNNTPQYHRVPNQPILHSVEPQRPQVVENAQNYNPPQNTIQPLRVPDEQSPQQVCQPNSLPYQPHYPPSAPAYNQSGDVLLPMQQQIMQGEPVSAEQGEPVSAGQSEPVHYQVVPEQIGSLQQPLPGEPVQLKQPEQALQNNNCYQAIPYNMSPHYALHEPSVSDAYQITEAVLPQQQQPTEPYHQQLVSPQQQGYLQQPAHYQQLTPVNYPVQPMQNVSFEQQQQPQHEPVQPQPQYQQPQFLQPQLPQSEPKTLTQPEQQIQPQPVQPEPLMLHCEQPESLAQPQQRPQIELASPEQYEQLDPITEPLDISQLSVTYSLPVTQNELPIKDQGVTATNAIDIGAVKEVADAVMPKGKPKKKDRLTRKERKLYADQLKEELKANKKDLRNVKKEEKQLKRGVDKNKYRSVKKRLKSQDKEAGNVAKSQMRKRAGAKDMLGYIGYERMYRDGVCEVEYDPKRGYGLYSETLGFDDISYQSSHEESQLNVFSEMCRLYNYFGADTTVAFTVINTKIPDYEVGTRKFFNPLAQDSEKKRNFAELYNKILNDKMREGVSNIRTNRYVTYAIGAESPDRAVVELASIRNSLMQCLTKVGSASTKLDGHERLKVLHSLMRPEKPFEFDYERCLSLSSPMTTKDYIVPSSMDFKPEGDVSCYFAIGDKFAQVLNIRQFGSELNDAAFSQIIDLPIPMCLTWYAQGMEKGQALNLVKKQLALMDNEIISKQDKANAKGRSFDAAIPSELRHSRAEATEVLELMQKQNQRLFMFCGLIYTYADSLEELNAQVTSIISKARHNSIEIEELHFRQREAFNSVLPLGNNHIGATRSIMTAEVAILMPFAAVDMQQDGGNFYGQSKESNNLLQVNPKMAVSPIGFISGRTGGGKSFFSNTEITNTVLQNPRDRIYILDRAGEYRHLAAEMGGCEVKFSVNSDSFLNPFGFDDVAALSRQEQIAFKIDAILAQATANAAENGRGLDDAERSIITRCVELAYQRAETNSDGSSTPTLGDFYDMLMQQPEEQAKLIALRYEMYVNGTMSFFNNQTNIDFKQGLIDINLRELPDSMLVFALINICEVVRNQMYANFAEGIRTWLYIEEIQSMFKYPTVINYFSRFAREGRKSGLILRGITQNTLAMLEQEEARDIVGNAGFIALLQQSPSDRKAWVNLLGLSPLEEQYIDESNDAGEGLLIVGAKKVPFKGAFPRGNALYDLFDTDPNKVEEQAQARQLKVLG